MTPLTMDASKTAKVVRPEGMWILDILSECWPPCPGEYQDPGCGLGVGPEETASTHVRTVRKCWHLGKYYGIWGLQKSLCVRLKSMKGPEQRGAVAPCADTSTSSSRPCPANLGGPKLAVFPESQPAATTLRPTTLSSLEGLAGVEVVLGADQQRPPEEFDKG